MAVRQTLQAGQTVSQSDECARQNGYTSLNVLTSMKLAKWRRTIYIRVGIGFFQRIEDGSVPKANSSTCKRKVA